MAHADPSEIRLFRWAEDIPPALWDDLNQVDPVQAAEATGAELVEGAWSLPMLGRAYLVDRAQRRISDRDDPERRVSYQAAMVLLTTLARSSLVLPAGRMVVPQELPGGSMFFTGPHAINNEPLARAFGHDPAEMVRRAAALGGKAIEGADAAVEVPGLPRVPLYAMLWRGDDEFPAEARVGIDAQAHFHLALDGVWALTNLLVSRLTREGRSG